ncbi:hypothetical protein JBO46_23930 [Serratia fonticola]|nr:hypothetical protein [Serratia fonticola]
MITSTTVYPREIARLALRLNAVAVICSHLSCQWLRIITE